LQPEAVADNFPLIVLCCDSKVLDKKRGLPIANSDGSRDENGQCGLLSDGEFANGLGVKGRHIVDSSGHLCKEALDVVLATHSITIVHQQTCVQVELVDQVPLLVHAIVIQLGELLRCPACLVIFISLALNSNRIIIQ
jgi:hypothetical protein